MMVTVEADLKLSLNPTALSLLTRVEDFLAEHNIRAYVVGGFLRDLVIIRDTADIDIALETNVLHIAPRIADHLGGKFVSLDEMNGVGRIILPEPGEHLDSSQWQIDFSTIEGSIEQDLARRDFTIDSMAIGLDKIVKGAATSEIIDPFNGLEDIERQVVKATGDTIFKDDAVRLLRAVRLAAELNFTISPETEALIRQS
jgi:poly(A) polymerase